MRGMTAAVVVGMGIGMRASWIAPRATCGTRYPTAWRGTRPTPTQPRRAGELCFLPSLGLGESTQSASRERVYTAYGMHTYGLRTRRLHYILRCTYVLRARRYVSTCVVRPTVKSDLHTRPWRPATVSAALDNFPSGGQAC
jgi:hypothetical protein